MVVRGKAGISPVVATVILVAVAIVIAIAVAFWASGLVGVFTRFEKIEIQSAYWDGDERCHYREKHRVKHRRSRHDIGQRSPMHTVADNRHDRRHVLDKLLVAASRCGGSIITGGVTNEIALHTTSGKTYPVAVLIP
jgi:hypothetical protein